MENRKYHVKVRYFFDGVYTIKAETREEAVRMVKEDCGLVMGGGVHTSLNADTVNWSFPIHPEAIIRSVKLKNKNCNRDKRR